MFFVEFWALRKAPGEPSVSRPPKGLKTGISETRGPILAPFWHLGPPFWRAWGIQGHPTGQQGVPGEIFIDLGWIWGPNWNPIW